MTGNVQQEQPATGRRWAAVVALLTMAITLLPFLIGWSFADKRHFVWLSYNVDDSCVYLSWMRQAADGSFRALNLFTTDPQHGMFLNPLFLVLGWIARITHLPLIGIYHLSRLAFGFGLLLTVWEFIRFNVNGDKERKCAFLLVCFSSGLGWLPSLWPKPIDAWQPEAITFLSLYLSPLFCFSMALQIGIILMLQQGERTGQIRYAIYAGACGFLLGFVHTYDIITMSAIWVGYLLVRLVRSRSSKTILKLSPHTWLHALVAGCFTFPSVAYIAWQLYTETVFRQRAEVKTLSGSLIWILLGYGLTLILALIGFLVSRTQQRENTQTTLDTDVPLRNTSPLPPDSLILLAVWAAVNLAVSYFPVAFQRKMLQGEHFPIAILAGVGLTWLLSRSTFLKQSWRYRFATALCVILLGISNILFVLRDMEDFVENKAQPNSIYRAYVQPGELDALEWIKSNTPQDVAIQPLPWVIVGQGKIGAYDATLACFTPGLIHRAVYDGHWGETPDHQTKLIELTDFLKPTRSDEARIAQLRKMKVDYLVFSQKDPQDTNADQHLPIFRGLAPLPTYLEKVYSNADADVYHVRLP